VTSRALLVGFLAVAAWLAGGAPASGDPPRSVSSYYLARADARLCPSPMCGGIWVRLVNRSQTTCGDGSGQRECYAAEADLRGLRVAEKRRAELQRLLTEGRALARGKLVGGQVEGFPDLDVLVVSEVWTASSSPSRPRGVLHRLRDNGVRCVTTPCFSVHAARLNVGRHVDLSDVDLSRSGTPIAEQRRALAQLSDPGLIATGRVGAEGRGRTFVASQFYVRAG
jgi:hypothetical protein